MRARKAVSPAAVIVLAAALVLLTAATSYIAYSNTMKIQGNIRNNLKVEVEMRREPKVSLMQGLPPGVSLYAYVVIHETSGYQEALYDIMYVDNRTGNIMHTRPYIVMNEGDCVILTPHYLRSIRLPAQFTSYINSTLVVHSSKAVARGVPRELKPDDVYPCMRLGSYRPRYEILLHVALNGAICARPECRALLTPEARPTAYVVNAYSIFNITAAPTARINNVDYTFVGWAVFPHPMQSNEGVSFTQNPLPLLADEAYDVVALYFSGDSGGVGDEWRGRNCYWEDVNILVCRP